VTIPVFRPELGTIRSCSRLGKGVSHNRASLFSLLPALRWFRLAFSLVWPFYLEDVRYDFPERKRDVRNRLRICRPFVRSPISFPKPKFKLLEHRGQGNAADIEIVADVGNLGYFGCHIPPDLMRYDHPLIAFCVSNDPSVGSLEKLTNFGWSFYVFRGHMISDLGEHFLDSFIWNGK